MKYNICTVQPPGYVHAHAFDEVAILIGAGLEDLGYLATINANKIDHDARNIIIGCHLLDPQSANIIPTNSIVLNTEQLSNEIGSWNQNIMFWLQRYEAWDYSIKNIENIKAVGLTQPKHLMLGFHEKLLSIPKARHQDIDVLFYGSMNERRRKTLDEISNRGLKVKELFGIYGKERDEWISRSKIVLNLHFFNTKIFEIVRCFYLMINSKAVVAEIDNETSINPLYCDGIYATSYANIADECLRLCSDQHARDEIEFKASKTIKNLPQKKLLQSLLI
ncbi:hypothetical protein KIH24_13395 [Rhizobiales bacterium TNE-4]|nr:hypothetical protein [Rhizobiales bacterium TNE-4]MBV1828613.1 hypothetical protein [Rhizobiales bacterium TNE-4]